MAMKHHHQKKKTNVYLDIMFVSIQHLHSFPILVVKHPPFGRWLFFMLLTHTLNKQFSFEC
jgi:hypothetical protein